MKETDAILAVHGLTVAYGGQKILDSVNFAVMPRDFICVVGANGSGKSTLAKAILGLIRPAAGEIIYGAGLARTQIGYLPQEAKVNMDFPATVLEIVLSGVLGRLGVRPFYTVDNKKCVLKTLKLLGISALSNKSFKSLSGGQKQKVLLARALVATTSLLILDEPSNNLDPPSRREFYQILKKLNQDQGLTIMMITHDLDVEDLVGNKVLAISSGKVTLDSTKQYIGGHR